MPFDIVTIMGFRLLWQSKSFPKNKLNVKMGLDCYNNLIPGQFFLKKKTLGLGRCDNLNRMRQFDYNYGYVIVIIG